MELEVASKFERRAGVYSSFHSDKIEGVGSVLDVVPTNDTGYMELGSFDIY